MMAAPARISAICQQVRVARRRWRLSQAQFAMLFATSVRTVRRWESGQLEPREHQKWLLALLIDYARTQGNDRLVQRFVNEPGRLCKAGRPCRSSSCRGLLTVAARTRA